MPDISKPEEILKPALRLAFRASQTDAQPERISVFYILQSYFVYCQFRFVHNTSIL